MSLLTRWVLAHKRIVVGLWVVLTVAGIMASGPASDALDQKFSVPGKEGWETNVAIAKHYGGTGGDTRPLLPVVTLPKGKTADSPGVKADLARIETRLDEALPGSRSTRAACSRPFQSPDARLARRSKPRVSERVMHSGSSPVWTSSKRHCEQELAAGRVGVQRSEFVWMGSRYSKRIDVARSRMLVAPAVAASFGSAGRRSGGQLRSWGLCSSAETRCRVTPKRSAICSIVRPSA
jgi:hypothetical protein